MAKRIIAIAVTLILLYTIGGRNERVYSEGLYQGHEGVQGRDNAVTEKTDRATESVVERDTGAVRDTRDAGPVSGDAGERSAGRIEVTEVRDDGQRNGKNNMVFIELGVTGSIDGNSTGGTDEADGNNAADADIGPANDDNAGPGSEEPVEGAEPDSVEDGTGPAADDPGEVQPVEEPVVEEPAPVVEEPQSEWTYYGNCRITFYCPGPCCCGSWAYGATASGEMPAAGWTVANGDLPFGTHVLIDGQEYCVTDRGVGGDQFDVFVDTHDEALARGLYYTDVYVKW